MVAMEVDVMNSPMDIDDESHHQVRNSVWGDLCPCDTPHMHILTQQKNQECNNKFEYIQIVPFTDTLHNVFKIKASMLSNIVFQVP